MTHENGMPSFSFIHAADIHLDTPFTSIAHNLPEQLKEQVRTAPFVALQRIQSIAIEKQVDFVILAGDIYNGEDKSIAGKLALQHFAKELESHAIALYIAHGNHDPLLYDAYMLPFPNNTTIFPAETVRTFPIVKEGTVVAQIQGISHSSGYIQENLSEAFPNTQNALFTIGVLHCSVGNCSMDKNKKAYAPCSLEDLRKKHIHYWALGHIHTREILSEYPHIVYPGNTQGVKSSEQGMRGVYYVEVEKDTTVHMEFINTAPVVFQTCTIHVPEESTLDQLFDTIHEHIEEHLYTNNDTSTVLHILSLVLTGHTNLTMELRKRSEEEWQDAIQHNITKGLPVWVQRVSIATKSVISIEELSARTDLLGETIKILNKLQEDTIAQEQLQEALKQQLPARTKYSRMSYSLRDIEVDIQAILEEAPQLCLQLFEGGK